MPSIVEVLSQLIKFKTLSEPYNKEEISKASDFLESIAKQHNAYIERGEVDGKLYLLVSTSKNPWAPKVGILAHVDVVPAEENEFNPRIEGDKLYGRGALDDKGPLVASLFALLNAKADASLLVTSDEETGGFMLEKLREKYNPEILLVPDGGEEDKIVIKEKGVLHFKLTTYGKNAHGSTPWEGKNAIEKAFYVYQLLKTILEEPSNHSEWRNTLNLGYLCGGDAPNKVPDKAEMKLDFRFTRENVNYWKEKINSILSQVEGVKFEELASGEVLVQEPNKYTDKYKEIAEKIYGHLVMYGFENGATDARWFAGKVKAMIMHYPKGGNIHSPKEWVSIPSLEKFSKVIEEFLKSL